jgi:FkbM family methyltransferase
MSFPHRPIAFVLAASNHGTMIVNRNDYHGDSTYAYGVGYQILDRSCFDPEEVAIVLRLLDLRRRYFGDAVFAVDGGANIGVHSIEWARHMHGWGRVLAFEAQEVVYYALAGNIALNNCLNARAKLAALGEAVGEIIIPSPNYFKNASFGSLELRKRERTEFIGQSVSYDEASGVAVPMVSIDSLALERVDFFKLDVEGMELDVLNGAKETLARCRPVMQVEYIKSDISALVEFLHSLGYESIYKAKPNFLAIHGRDPVRQHLRLHEGRLDID